MLGFDQTRWFAVIPSTLIATAGLFHTANATKRPVCQRASEWVASHQADLPLRYAEIRKYPTIYQRTIYGNLSPAQRAVLWREKLSVYSAKDSDLPREQHDLVLRLLRNLPNYTGDPNGILRGASAKDPSFVSELREAFGAAELQSMFGQLDTRADSSVAASDRVGLGATTGIAGTLANMVENVSNLLGHSRALAAFSTCSCHDGDNTGCPFGTQCKLPQGMDRCTPTPTSVCGFDGDQTCNGLCY